MGQYGQVGMLFCQTVDILASAAGEVIDANNLVAGLNQLLAQVKSQKAGAAAHQDPLILLAHFTTPDFCFPTVMAISSKRLGLGTPSRRGFGWEDVDCPYDACLLNACCRGSRQSSPGGAARLPGCDVIAVTLQGR